MAIDQALAGVRLHRCEAFPGSSRVFIHTGFRRQIAFALTKPAVVDRQDGIAHGAQLFDAKRLAGEVPAHTVQIEDRRRITTSCRPPPGMQVLPILETGGLDVEFLNVLRQTAIPARRARFDTKQQLALGVLKHAATHRQADNQRGHAQQGQPASAQTCERGGGHRMVRR
ncbi:hypothetical protein D3C84_781590 [compost metagenome]